MARLFTLLFVLALGAQAFAQTSVQVRPAWGGKDRAGRWNAVLVRASDVVPRGVTLQLISAEPAGFATVVEEHVAIGPTPATFEVMLPVHTNTWRQTIAVVRDAGTGKFLAQYPSGAPGQGRSPDVPVVGPQTMFVGTTGTTVSVDLLAGALGADFGYLPAHQLPRSTIGYDSLEVLLLNRPRWVELDVEQQLAILDWVRAGGSVLFTPGDDSPAGGSPLAAALPCRVGELRQVELSSQARGELGLSGRFARIAVRGLEPEAGAEPVALFKDTVTGFSRRLGLGRIVVLPFDVRTIEAGDPADRQGVIAIWQSIFHALVRLPRPPTDTPRFAAPYNGFMSESPEQFREGAATSVACDFLARPGDHRARRWPYVALVLLGIFALVGPVETLVLKSAGLSPWTWTTMVGWIACFVLGGLYVASIVSRPPAVFGTVRLIEQSDDATVATTDLVAVRAPEGGGIEPVPAESAAGWWEPALPGSVAVGGGAPVRLDVAFHGSDESCVPVAPHAADETRFFRRQSLRPSGPAVAARLRLVGNGTSARVIGTVQNLLPTPLKDLRLRTVGGVVPIGLDSSAGVLGSGQTITIDVPVAGEVFSPAKFEDRYQSFGDWGSRTDTAVVREQDLWAVVPDLAGRRSMRIDGLFESNAAVACLYAQCVNPSPTAKPTGTGDIVPLRSHEWLRALISLPREPI